MKALIINCSPVRTGATAEIVKIISTELGSRYETKCICIDDYSFSFCRGCRACHKIASCVMDDASVIKDIINEFDDSDIIISVAPSYWADVPGQYKAFIDRCTPWCNTHEPHASLKPGKKGYAVVLRTGPNMKECNRLIETIEHFYGHMEIECSGHIGFTGIEYKDNIEPHIKDIKEFCDAI